MIDKNDPRLTAYLLDELDDDGVAEVQAAIDISPELKEHVEGLRATIGLLHTSAQSVAATGPTQLTIDQREQIEQQAIAPVSPVAEKDPRSFWRHLAIAALVLYAVGMSYLALKPRVGTPTEIAKLDGRPDAADIADGSGDSDGSADPSVRYRYETRTREVPVTTMATETQTRAVPVQKLRTEIRTREVPVTTMRTQTKTRSVPVQKIRKETRTRTVTKDGEEIEETYQVDVPYTENVEQSYTVQVPVQSTRTESYSVSVPYTEQTAQTYTVQVPVTSMRTESYQVRVPIDENGRVIGEPESVPVSDGSGAPRLADGQAGGGRDAPSANADFTDVLETANSADPQPTDDLSLQISASSRVHGNGDNDEFAVSFDDAMDRLDAGETGPAVLMATPGIVIGEEEDRAQPELFSELEESAGTIGGQGFDTAPDGRIFASETPGRRVKAIKLQTRVDPESVLRQIQQLQAGGESGLAESEAEAPPAPEPDDLLADKTEPSRVATGGSLPTEAAGVIGDAAIEFVPEGGQIIIKGAQRDVQRIRELVEEIEADQSIANDEREKFAMDARAAVASASRNAVALRAELLSEHRGETISEEQKRKARERYQREVQAAKSKREELERKVTDARKRAKQRIKTWKPASAATNRARLSVGHHDDLQLAARDTYVRIDGFRARVFFDLYYYNERAQRLEGQFLLRLPSDASLHYFAFGTTNLPAHQPAPATGKPGEAPVVQRTSAQTAVQTLREVIADKGTDLGRRADNANYVAAANTTFASVKSAHVVPRQKAALAYEETVRRRVDPALVEWAGPGIFQTKVFPLMPKKLHRIVVGYDVNLLDEGNDRIFQLDLPEGEAGGRVEFDIAAASGTQVDITPETDPFISGKRAYYRYESSPPRDYTVRLIGSQNVVLQTGKPSGGVGGTYFATRVKANLPDDPAKVDSDSAVFLLDTSWSDRPVAFARRLKLMQEILRSNRDQIKSFAVLMFNVEQRWWRSELVPNNAANVKAFTKDANSIALEGATDLHGALQAATTTDWLSVDSEDSKSPQPNFFLLSDAVATWGSTDLASLASPLSKVDRSGGGGALFAYHLAGQSSDKATMGWIAEAAGGAVFDVPAEAELAEAATAHRSRPWRITGVTAKGADEILIQGGAQSVYPGQTLMVAGQGKLAGPVKIEFARGREKKTLSFEAEVTVASPTAGRLYGQFAVEQLEPYANSHDSAEAVTVAFARYFRVPGRTCSMVMLETAEDYKRFGVQVSPAEDALVIASTSVDEMIASQQARRLEQHQNPLKQFTAWTDTLQSASLIKLPTALRLAMARLPDDTFAFRTEPLECRSWKLKHCDKTFAEELQQEKPMFDMVMAEADRKRKEFGVDDAIKTASTMIEVKSSDPDTLRSVAFRAIEWERSDQAAPLLWRLAKARPYQPQCLLLLGRALSESGDTDGAIVCFDLVAHGNWNNRWASGAKEIANIELLHLLEQVDQNEVKSSIRSYARARLSQLRDRYADEGMDVAVVMHWNTDRTDVDLHVTEPTGEVCNYQHKTTKSGGRITQDITQGLGPEMYFSKTAPDGDFKIEAKYYSNDNNRTKTPSETLVTVYENLGRRGTKKRTAAITLTGKDEMQTVMKLKR